MHKKWSFPLKVSSVNVTESAVSTFTEEILNRKLHAVLYECTLTMHNVLMIKREDCFSIICRIKFTNSAKSFLSLFQIFINCWSTRVGTSSRETIKMSKLRVSIILWTLWSVKTQLIFAVYEKNLFNIHQLHLHELDKLSHSFFLFIVKSSCKKYTDTNWRSRPF